MKILGRKSSDDGVDDPDSYEYLAEMIGNKTLLEEHINNQLKQKSFLDKCNGTEVTVKKKTYVFPGYRKSAVEMTQDISKLTVWDEQTINRRTEWVKDCFLEIFQPTRPPSNLRSFNDWNSKTS
jgi:hypothetical protein